MSNFTSYLLRRGDNFTFRIAVPADLRGIIGLREITKTLSTSNRHKAAPLALEYAAKTKRMFYEVRVEMNSPKKYKPRQKRTPEQEQFLSRWGAALEEVLRDNADAVNSPKKYKPRQKRTPEQEQFLARWGAEVKAMMSGNATAYASAAISTPDAIAEDSLRLDYITRMIMTERGPEMAFDDAKPEDAEAIDSHIRTAITAFYAAQKQAPTLSISNVDIGESAPMLNKAIDKFLAEYPNKNPKGMYGKHQYALPLFLEVVGDKPVSRIVQSDLNKYFSLLLKLPPRWKDECRKQKINVTELAERKHLELIGPKTFTYTYRTCISTFLTYLVGEGFTNATALTVKPYKYKGVRVAGEDKQRAFKLHELERLFCGQEMQKFASRPDLAHCYWLPHLGLFTGARINELCQINPQVDVLQDSESGEWHLWITDETEADSRIRKSVKTGDSRKVPLHKKLIELGFLEYVIRLKSKGEKLLFPAWKPVNERASGNAEDWFRDLLRDTDLRDETPFSNILGAHAFRHTLLTYGAIQEPTPLRLFCITGHAQDGEDEDLPFKATGAARGYLDASLLAPVRDKAELLNKLDYKINFIKPA
ncbi:MAG: hypothetical protein P4L87_25400 [Formivibrio sp.]|nr:hypothetical protein [Formivibrio sp.]